MFGKFAEQNNDYDDDGTAKQDMCILNGWENGQM